MSKSLLLTGSSGFLGKHIHARLLEDRFEVVTIGRNKCDIPFDLAEGVPELPNTIDYVIHAAGKAHIVPKTEAESQMFYKTNYEGTLNLLEGLKASKSALRGIIFISSVAVYGIMEGAEIDENTELMALDPYGKSKIMAEQAVSEFCVAENIACCILRLPLIAGKNPPGNLGSMIQAIKKGFYLSIGNANVKKSMVLAKDVASLIPNLFEKSGIYNLTDGYHPTFHELETALSRSLKKRKPLKIPQFAADIMAKIGDIIGNKSPINTSKLKKIQSELTFSDLKAVRELQWNPHKVTDNILTIIE